MSARDALNKFYAKQTSTLKPKRKNKTPEADFKKEAMAWLNSKGFSVHSIESKAVYSRAAGRYLRGQTDSGVSDIVGVTPIFGIACFIELKAPGKRSTLKLHQRQFLLGKIEKYAFSICTDSIDHLLNTFSRWAEMVSSGLHKEAQEFLIKDLP
ncbi:MAG: hypothetical protein IT190_09940 [Microbacteriaceae bacterium]|nr:hypothetical protein [Microbacteriaceae bacterium]